MKNAIKLAAFLALNLALTAATPKMPTFYPARTTRSQTERLSRLRTLMETESRI